MSVLRLIAQRLVISLLTLLLVAVIVFVVVELLPGDVATRILGRDATPETIAVFRERMNLDAPPAERFAEWLGSIVTGDLGYALTSGRPISRILAPRIQNTLILAGLALLLYIPLSLIPAMLQALYRDRPIDQLLSTVNLIAVSLPDFLLGTILLIAFAVTVPLFPAMSLVDETSDAAEYLRACALPALTLAIVMAAYAIRMLRDNLVEILDADFVRMAELKGLPRRKVLVRHALPNSLVPTLNITALNLGYVIGGVVIVERVFSYPGFGSLMVDALTLRDIPLIEATVLIAAAVYIAANLLADVGAILLNPRLRQG